MVIKKRTSVKVRAWILEHIDRHPRDLVSYAAKKFSCSRQNVHRVLRLLIREGLVIQRGEKKAAVYQKAGKFGVLYRAARDKWKAESEIWDQNIEPKLTDLSDGDQVILRYILTELLNNCLDHSNATHIKVSSLDLDDEIRFQIEDDGIGIFENLCQKLGIKEPREAVFHLSKGKITTDPSRHTGEGIFFSSRACHYFKISSGSLQYIRNMGSDDWSLESIPSIKGTWVEVTLLKNVKYSLKDVFEKYSSSEDFRFDKTHILVKHIPLEEPHYISRSEAKRLLLGLEKFAQIVLDFKNVKSVGQGFVDEVFRVFKEKHTNCQLQAVNTNADVDFMIRRGSNPN